jgi:hypothetical protein
VLRVLVVFGRFWVLCGKGGTSSETARVHHAARRCGGSLAACLAGAAGRANATRRRAHPADDPGAKARIAAFLEGLAQLGWTDGRNVRIDTRWGAGDVDRIRRYAAELVALEPDVILATATATVAPLQQATRTVPIVFASVIDPVGAGFVASMARPGGNITGFTVFEYGISGNGWSCSNRSRPA